MTHNYNRSKLDHVEIVQDCQRICHNNNMNEIYLIPMNKTSKRNDYTMCFLIKLINLF